MYQRNSCIRTNSVFLFRCLSMLLHVTCTFSTYKNKLTEYICSSFLQPSVVCLCYLFNLLKKCNLYYLIRRFCYLDVLSDMLTIRNRSGSKFMEALTGFIKNPYSVVTHLEKVNKKEHI